MTGRQWLLGLGLALAVVTAVLALLAGDFAVIAPWSARILPSGVRGWGVVFGIILFLNAIALALNIFSARRRLRRTRPSAP